MNGDPPIVILLITFAVVGLLFAPIPTGTPTSLPTTPAAFTSQLNVSCELTNGLSPWPGQSYNSTGTNYTRNVTIIWHKLCATTLFGDLIDEWGDLRSTMVNGTTEWAAANLTPAGGPYPNVGVWQLTWKVWNGTPGNRAWCHEEIWYSDVVNNTFSVSPILNNDVCVMYTAPMVAFFEDGLPTGTAWSIFINGTTRSATTDIMSFVLPNGTYPYKVGNISGFSAFPSTGVVIMQGSSVGVTINFTSTASPVAPTLLGLPSEVTYVVLGAAVGVVALALALFVWRGGRRKSNPAQEDGRPPDAK